MPREFLDFGLVRCECGPPPDLRCFVGFGFVFRLWSCTSRKCEVVVGVLLDLEV